MFLHYEKREMISMQDGLHFRGDKYEKYVRCIWAVHTSDGEDHTIIGDDSGWDPESATRRARADANRMLHESLPEWGRMADERIRQMRAKERLGRDIAKMVKDFERHKKS